MGNELAKIDANDYLALGEDRDLAAAVEANLDDGGGIEIGDLVRIPTPSGGGTTWSIETIEGEETTPEIIGILVLQKLHGVLWPNEEPSEGTSPLLVSDDLIVGRKVGDDYGDLSEEAIESTKRPDGLYDWRALPYTQMGSGRGGIGKRAKEGRMLAILRPGEMLPVIVRAQPGSAMIIRKFIRSLRVPYWRAVVSLSLVKQTSKGGQKYSQIVPKLVGVLSDEQGAIVRDRYTEPLRAALNGLSSDRGTSESDF